MKLSPAARSTGLFLLVGLLSALAPIVVRARRRASRLGRIVPPTDSQAAPPPSDATGVDGLPDMPPGENLTRANMVGANLDERDLRAAVLTDADLSGASLRRVRLDGADLAGTILHRAILQGANLTDARNLTPVQVAGADLSGIQPKDILTFELLAFADKAIDSAGKMLLSILLACGLALAIVISTGAAQLLTQSGTAKIPILSLDLPIVWFFYLTPVILVCAHAVFQLTAQRVWDALTALPAIFPDGVPVDQKVPPWLMSGLLRANLPILAHLPRTSLTWLQARLSSSIAYSAVPLTLIVFWARYLLRHDPLGSGFHVISVTLSVFVSLFFSQLAVSRLRGKDMRRYEWPSNLKYAETYRLLANTFILLAGLLLLTIGSIYGVPPRLSDFRTPGLTAQDPRKWAPRFLSSLGFAPYADLTKEDVSDRPASWTGSSDFTKLDQGIAAVKGCRLRGCDLRYMQAEGAFLVKADMENVQANDCLLNNATLCAASLTRADLRHSSLREADLREAALDGAWLNEADLSSADARMASLREAHLDQAEMEETDLRHAVLASAGLRHARLNGAKCARCDFSQADLRHALLRSADLSECNLTGAWLDDADLTDADLTRADLRDTLGLTPARIRGARNWQTAKLPARLTWLLNSAPKRKR